MAAAQINGMPSSISWYPWNVRWRRCKFTECQVLFHGIRGTQHGGGANSRNAKFYFMVSLERNMAAVQIHGL